MKSFIHCIALGLVFVLGASAIADDLNPPPWPGSWPNQTRQEWVPAAGTGFVPPLPIQPTQDGNPYGPAELLLEGEWNFEESLPPEGTQPIPTWHVGQLGGDLVLTIPNNPEPLPFKQIYWQITADKSVGDAARPPFTNPPGQVLPPPYPQVQWPNGTWYTYNGLIEIQPNPDMETITFPNLIPSTNISQVVVYTVCAPEPSTLLFAGASLPWLLGRRRR